MNSMAFYAEKYTSKLSDKQKKIALATLYLVESAPHGTYWFSGNSIYLDIEGEIESFPYKALIFMDSTIYDGPLQDMAFLTLEGDELNCYVENFIKAWEEDFVKTWDDTFSAIETYVPEPFFKLVSNKDFKLDHIKPLLKKGSHITRSSKNFLIRLSAEKFQLHANEHLNKDEVDYLLNLGAECLLDLSPIFPSIRHHFDLKDVPDSWLWETYCT